MAQAKLRLAVWLVVPVVLALTLNGCQISVETVKDCPLEDALSAVTLRLAEGAKLDLKVKWDLFNLVACEVPKDEKSSDPAFSRTCEKGKKWSKSTMVSSLDPNKIVRFPFIVCAQSATILKSPMSAWADLILNRAALYKFCNGDTWIFDHDHAKQHFSGNETITNCTAEQKDNVLTQTYTAASLVEGSSESSSRSFVPPSSGVKAENQTVDRAATSPSAQGFAQISSSGLGGAPPSRGGQGHSQGLNSTGPHIRAKPFGRTLGPDVVALK